MAKHDRAKSPSNCINQLCEPPKYQNIIGGLVYRESMMCAIKAKTIDIDAAKHVMGCACNYAGDEANCPDFQKKNK